MKKFLMVCLGILLVGCGKEEIADREKDGRNVDSSQQSASAHTQPPPSAEQGGMADVANVEPVQGEPLALGRLTQLSCVAFSPDGRILALGAAEGDFPSDGVVRMWDVTTRRELATLRHPGEILSPTGGWNSTRNCVSSLAFSPDGKTLATGTEVGTAVWDIGSGRELIKLPGYGQSEAKVSSVEFSPDGKSLATAGNSGCKLWDVSTWQERKTLTQGTRQTPPRFLRMERPSP